MRKRIYSQNQIEYAPTESLRHRYLSASLGLTLAVTPLSAFANSTLPIVHTAPVIHNTAVIHASNGSLPTSNHPVFVNHATPVPPVNHSSKSLAVIHNTTTGVSSNALNLGSSTPNYSLAGLANFHSLTIDVGGKSEVVGLTTKLTAAELVAAQQVSSGSHQTLTINASGVATGGVFDLTNQSLGQIDNSLGTLGSLFVPHNVKVIDGLSTLNLTGNLVNHGTIVAAPTNKTGDTIHADNILNASGASISGGTYGNGAADFALTADHALTNSGSITSSGNLTITAASITNVPSAHEGGTIVAANNLNLSSPSVTNSGMLKATAGNVNFSSTDKLTLDNTGGTVSAGHGNVNIFANNNNIDLNGGDVISKQLNLNAGTGDVNVNAGNITGLVNVTATNAHVSATSADLQLGAMDVTDDPTYFNQGNITISGAMLPTNGSDLAIVASGNILSNGGSLDTSPTSGKGGNLSLIAGANFTTSTGSKAGSDDSTTTLTITTGPGSGGGSTTGGLIDLSGGHGGGAALTNLTTAGGGLAGNSGSIEMVAFAGTGVGSGSVTVPQTLTINAASNAVIGNGGAVTIIAGAKAGTAISTGNINTNGHGTADIGGAVSLAAATPVISAAVTITDGTQTNSFSQGNVYNGAIKINNVSASSAPVTIESHSSITFKTIDTSGAGGRSFTNTDGATGLNGGSVTIVGENGSITGSNIFAFGGGGGGGSVNTSTNSGTNGGLGGNGGQIEVITNFTGSIIMTGQINNSGGGGGGGAGASSLGSSGTPGAGGAGGTAENIVLSAGNRITVPGGIFSVDGGAGGSGGPASGLFSGNGGGGGGSYGGGGGGGAGGVDNSGGSLGGGGGGGTYGGGGGSSFGNGGATPATGGGGGGFGAGGTGGIGTLPSGGSAPGTKLAGGTAVNAGGPVGTGGSLGNGGLGSSDSGSGNNVVNMGVISGGTLTLQSSTVGGGAGTATTPLLTLVPFLVLNSNVSSAQGSYYINNLGPLTVKSFYTPGTIQLQAAGDLLLGTISTFNGATNLTLITAPGSNGNITAGEQVSATNTVVRADGSGNVVTSPSAALEGSTSLTITSGTGNIGTSQASPCQGFLSDKVTLNTNGNIYFDNLSTVSLQKSSSGSGDFDFSTTGKLTVAGAVSASGGDVNLTGAEGIIVKANITAGGAGGVSLTTTNAGNIVEQGVTLNNPSGNNLLTFILDNGSVGSAAVPFLTGASTVYIIENTAGANVYVRDVNTGVTTVNSLGASGENLSISSVASSLNYADSAGASFYSETIKNTSALGGILLGNAGDGVTTVSTVGGNIAQTAGDTLTADALHLVSTSGSIGEFMAMNIATESLTVQSAANSSVNLKSSTGLTLLNSTTGNLILNDSQTSGNLFVAGTVKATSLSITTGATNLQVEGGTLLSGGTITLDNTKGTVRTLSTINATNVTLETTDAEIDAFGKIGNGTGIVDLNANGLSGVLQTSTGLITGTTVDLSAVSLPTTINVAAQNLTVSTLGNATVVVQGNTILGASTVAGNLNLSSTGKITQSGTDMFGSANITSLSFVQASGSNLQASGLLALTTKGAGTAIDVEGTVNAGTANFVTAATSAAIFGLTNSGSTTIAPNLSIQTSHLTVDGNLLTTAAPSSGSLSIENPTSNLLIDGDGLISGPLSVMLTAGGTLTLKNTVNFAPISNFTANSIIIQSKGLLTLPLNNIMVSPNPVTKAGGTITLTASTISHPAGGMNFIANGQFGTSGNGGQITLDLTGKQNLTFDMGSNNWTAYAKSGSTGGNGGAISIKTAGTLTVNTIHDAVDDSPQGATGNGGALTFGSGSNLQIVGSVGSAGVGGGSAGEIDLSANGAKPFVLDQTTLNTNGVFGIVSGGNVIISNPTGININASSSILSNGALLQLNAAEVTNASTTNPGIGGTSGQFTVSNPTGNLTISGAGKWAPTGSISFVSGGNLNLGTLFGASAITSSDNITLTAKGTLTLGTDQITAAEFSTGAGGIISIAAKSLAYSIPTPTPLTLTAQGNFVGGIISLALSGTAPLTLGTAKGNVEVTVNPTNVAATTGGAATISNGGNLTVNLSGLITDPSAQSYSSQVSLTAGTAGPGILLVTSWNSIVIGSQGDLTATANSATQFQIGPTATNGIVTSTAIVGNMLNVTNNGGNVFINGTDFLNAATGTVSIVAKGNIIQPSVTLVPQAVNGATVSLKSTTGSIGTIATTNVPFIVAATNLSANAGVSGNVLLENESSTVTLGNSYGRVFNLETNQNLNVSGSIGGTTITLETGSNGFLLIGNSIGNGAGVVTLGTGIGGGTLGSIGQSGGVVNATTLDLLQASNVTLTATNISTFVTGAGAQLAALTLDNIGTKALTIGTLTTSTGNINITALGAITTSGAITAGTADTLQATLNSGGAITIGKALTGGNVSLNSSNGGAITTTTTGLIDSPTASFTSDSGSIGTGKGLNLDVDTITVGTTGAVALADTVTASNITLGNVTLPVRSFVFNATTLTGDVLVNNITTSNGSISIVTNSIDLIENSNATLATTNGNVTLQNLNATTGNIVLNPNATIHGSGTAPGIGQVNLYIGPTPTKLIAGSLPSNIEQGFSGTGKIYYGPATTVQANNSISQVNAFGRNVVFNSPGGANGTIILNGNNVITADPPGDASVTVNTGAGSAFSLVSPSANATQVFLNANLFAPVASAGQGAGLKLNASSVEQMSTNHDAATGGIGLFAQFTSSNPSASNSSSWLAAPSMNALLNMDGTASLSNTNVINSNLNNTGLNNPSSINTSPINTNLTTTNSAQIDRSEQVSKPIQGEVSVIHKTKDRFGSASTTGAVSKRLDNGALLIAPDLSTVIETKFGSVSLQPRTCALVIATESGLTVFDFDGTRSGGISIKVGQQAFQLNPGQHMTVTGSNVNDFASVNPALFVGHRQMRSVNLDGKSLFLSEFHMMSALKGLPAVAEMSQSSDQAKKRTTSHILKTMALINAFSPSAVPYETYAPPTMTAMNR